MKCAPGILTATKADMLTACNHRGMGHRGTRLGQETMDGGVVGEGSIDARKTACMHKYVGYLPPFDGMTDDEVRSHNMPLLVPGEGALTIVIRRPLPSVPRPDPFPSSRTSSIVSIISSTTASSAIPYHPPTPAFLFDGVCA
ncbi:hypothetical protein N7G274_010591 [Stereocaulon virgatum]|uniref:Uncharacterized protein n=1 Tax=Stereocaulon virgatum TaxID=373712 RepID=A0ABR3ZVF1_9LECA